MVLLNLLQFLSCNEICRLKITCIFSALVLPYPPYDIYGVIIPETVSETKNDIPVIHLLLHHHQFIVQFCRCKSLEKCHLVLGVM
jgi:hypothetical protein